jgi:D-beta-D-heptose 7-phosphate kinase/D-beta-D-heptose 1-phosphate adenosyltransferase
MSIEGFSDVNVLIVGDLMLDRYWLGAAGRISPEAPVPVVKVDNREDKPGGAANVALNAAALGAKVTLIGMTGADEAANTLQSMLNAVGVDCDFVQSACHQTTTKLRVVSRNQQLIRLDFEQNFANADHQALLKRYQTHLANADIVILSDYAKGALHSVQQLIQLAKKAKKSVVVDPKGTDFTRYQGATLLTPNMSEFELVSGVVTDEAELVNQARYLVESLQMQALLVTRSEKGMTLVQRNKEEVHLPAKAKEVYDVTGAGDTVISALALAIGAGIHLPEACTFANAAASVVVGKLGTATVSLSEVLNAMTDKAHQDTGIMNEQQLIHAVTAAKAKGETIIMTNGCFDILHSGHVAYLSEAAKLGDRLIVAVNSDDSVTRLKGQGRPINSVDRRMAVLAGLSSVDWVVSFSEDTPQRIISEILPDILVKGGDYQVEHIAGGKEVMANGGQVRVLNFEEGISTTGILERMGKK